MESFKSAFRSLRAHPGFSCVIILLLALGIGANTAIFGVVHAVLLKPLPYPDPGDLVLVRKPPRDGNSAAVPGNGDQMPDNEFLAWLEASPKSFRALAGYRNSAATLLRGDGAIHVPSATVTGEFFPLLGVSAWRGRLFGPDDSKPGAAPVTVLSYSAWQSHFNGRDDALGQIAKLDEIATTVIGVLPPSFEFVDAVQYWRPLAISPSGQPGQLRIQLLRAFGRLLPGTDHAAAQRELDRISERFWDNLSSSLFSGPRPGPPLPAESPGSGTAERGASSAPLPVPPGMDARSSPTPGGPGPRLATPFASSAAQLVTLQEQLAHQSRTTLWLLLGAVVFVLLIACANIANLQLARAAGRRRESAVRAALGASPGRLLAELLIENSLLALAGGALGILLAWWGTQGLQVWLANQLPRINPIGVDAPVLGFAVMLATAAGIGFGLAPAWQGSRVDLLETLKEGRPGSSPSGNRWRQGLVALEVALALVLAVNTGLLMKSIDRLYATELGYHTSDVLTANLLLPRRYGTPVQQRDFARRWLEALQVLPGVKRASLTDAPPLAPYATMIAAVAQGSAAAAATTAGSLPPMMSIVSVSPEFFRATGIALRDGRFFGEQDGPEAPPVAIVNQEFARQFYPRGLTLGATVNLPGPSHPGQSGAAIIGVVADIRARGLEGSAQPLVYFPFAQEPRARISAVLQFEGDPAALGHAVTGATQKIDAELALDVPRTLEAQIEQQTAPRRVTLALTAAFAATAIALAALGIFGVMSYTVTLRTQEIGIRIALGANSSAIFRWILRYAGLAIGVGLVAGLALTLATSRLLTSLLHGVTALDPGVLVLSAAGLMTIGLAACLVPAIRAMRVNPVVALRSD